MTDTIRINLRPGALQINLRDEVVRVNMGDDGPTIVRPGDPLRVVVNDTAILINLKGGGGGGVTDIAAVIHASDSKAAPVDADELGLYDSVSTLLNKLTWANLKATLKTYFDGLYSNLVASTTDNTIPRFNGTGGQLQGSGVVIDDNNNVGIGTTSPAQKLTIENGHMRFNQVTCPTSPSVAVNATAGNLNGTYYYRVSYVTALGETRNGAVSASVAPANQKVDLTNIPVSSDSTVTARRVYRTTAGGNTYQMKRVAEISDNVTTTYTDNISDGSLGAYAQWHNTTGGIGYNGTLPIWVADDGITAFGLQSLASNKGYQNTAFGKQALMSNTYGGSNNALGIFALGNNTTGSENTAMGVNALSSVVSGSDNTGVGYSTLTNSTGSNNTAIGAYAGRTLTSNGSNTFIGYGSGYNASQKVDATNSTAIGNGAYTTASNQVVIGNSSVTQTQLRGDVLATSFNGVVPTETATGFTLEGGTASKTLTVDETKALSDKANKVGVNQWTGFVNRTDSTMSIDGSRLFTITKVSTSYTFYSNGVEYTYTTAKTTTIASTVGLHYIYFDTAGALQNTMSMWDIASANVPVAIVFWNGTAGAVCDERHHYMRNGITHKQLHECIGCLYESGLGGTFSSPPAFSIAAGEIHDEDIDFEISSPQTSCRILYRHTGAATMTFDTTPVTTPYKMNGSNLRYDNGGALADVGANHYGISWIYATLDTAYPIYCVLGQGTYTTLASAQAAGLPTIPLSTAEWKLLYKVIYRNTGATPTYVEAHDYRTSTPLPAISSGSPSTVIASNVITNTTAFDGGLTTADTTVQAALDTLDSHLPVSTTDNALARYDSTHGVLQNSTVIVGDDGSMNLGEVLSAEKCLALEYANWTHNDYYWTIGSGAMVKAGDGTGMATAKTTMGVQVGHLYKVTITVSTMSVAGFTYFCGYEYSGSVTAAGTYTTYHVAQVDAAPFFEFGVAPSADGSRFTISSISVKEVTGGKLTAKGMVLDGSVYNAAGLEVLGVTASGQLDITAPLTLMTLRLMGGFIVGAAVHTTSEALSPGTPLHYCNSASPIVLTISAKATVGTLFGRIIIVKNIGAGTVTLDPDGAETIDGASTYTLVSGASVMLQDYPGSSTDWKVLAFYDANAVSKTLYDPNSILYATSDNTPVALTVGTNSVVGRVAGEITTLAVDPDLSSVSAADDTVPSAKATKAYADTKLGASAQAADSHTVDGKHVGTSGNTVPVLDGANTWTGIQTHNANMIIQAGKKLIFSAT